VCHTYDNARPKPYCYVITNRNMTHALVVDIRTTAHRWNKVTRFDHKRGREREFYECPVALTRCESMKINGALSTDP
jgi:hypothetical protein